MGLLHPTRQLPLLQSKLKQLAYPASVVANDDSKHPDKKKRQRVTVRSPVLHRNVNDEDLPWAMPQRHGTANAGGGVGTVDVPPVGAKVFIHFDEEDPHLVYYTTSPTTDDVHSENEILNEDYPNSSGHVDAYGNKYVVNRKQGYITDTHKSGSTISRDKDGNFSLYAAKDFNISASGNINIVSEKGIKLHGLGGDTSIKGSHIYQNCSDSAGTVSKVEARQTPKTRTDSNDTQE